MLSRKAGYIRYAEQRQEAVPADRNFSGLILRTLSVVGLICFFLLTYIALSAAKTDYGYALMNEKRQVQALQRENENLRVDMLRRRMCCTAASRPIPRRKQPIQADNMMTSAAFTQGCYCCLL